MCPPKNPLFKNHFIASALILSTNVSALLCWALTDVLGLLSSMRFSNVHACPLGDAAGDVSAASITIFQQNSIVISWFISIGSSHWKKWFSETKKGKFLQFKTHFSIRQELYWRLSIVRCWQIPHIFHIRPPKTRHCFKTRGISSTRDSGWP